MLTTHTEVVRHREGVPPTAAPDCLAREEPLEIRVHGRSIAVTMRTPGHDHELACGFLIAENVVRKRVDVVEIAHCPTEDPDAAGNVLNVFIAPSVQVEFDHLSRHTFSSSSCGLCGKLVIDAIQQKFPPIANSAKFASEVLRQLPEKLRQFQDTFAKTGGLHAAAIFDLQGEMLVTREDVGRHNAVDKAIGWAFLERRLPLSEALLLVSGRASFEIMQKALAARIPIVAAVSAPSSLAVQFARESNQTLIGFLRGASFNVYSHPQRLR